MLKLKIISWRDQDISGQVSQSKNEYKAKHLGELKTFEEEHTPLQNKPMEAEEQIRDQKAKIQAVKSQILNTTTINNMFNSFVTTK